MDSLDGTVVHPKCGVEIRFGSHPRDGRPKISSTTESVPLSISHQIRLSANYSYS